MAGRQNAGPASSLRTSWPALLGCAALAVTGILTALACLLALYLEASGFGGAPRDGGMRPGYTAQLLAGAAAGILLPAAVSFAVLPASRRLIVLAVAVAAAAVAILLMGITGL